MSKYEKSFKRITSVISTHLVFTKLLDSKSEWEEYIKCFNEVDTELEMDKDFITLAFMSDKQLGDGR